MSVEFYTAIYMQYNDLIVIIIIITDVHHTKKNWYHFEVFLISCKLTGVNSPTIVLVILLQSKSFYGISYTSGSGINITFIILFQN